MSKFFSPPLPDRGEPTALAHDVKVLQAMVASLAKTLIDQGDLDGVKLDDNFQDQLLKLLPRTAPAGPPPAPTMPDIPGLYRGQQPRHSSAPPPPPEPTVACAKCAREVPRSKTNVTGEGLWCDDCYAKAPL